MSKRKRRKPKPIRVKKSIKNPQILPEEKVSFSREHLREIRINSNDVESYLAFTEAQIQELGRKDFFLIKVTRNEKTGRVAYEIFNGRGQLVSRDNSFFSDIAAKLAGHATLELFHAGTAPAPEINTVTETLQ